MSTEIILALDAMGGDHGPEVTLPAALLALSAHADLTIRVYGKAEALNVVLSRINTGADARLSRLEIIDAPEQVEMNEQPSAALRSKKQSSMRLAVNAVKDGAADAMVSAGNTGALMAISKFVLKTLPGVSRPAIVTAIPCASGHFYMLDLGANVDCDAQMLLQFALMGSTLASVMEKEQSPRVGLLNIGEEAIKGNEQVKLAHEKLSQDAHLNYIGYVEGDSIFEGVTDVVVCDGFVGNVALKCTEGTAKLIASLVKEEVRHSWPLKVLAAIAYPFFRRLKKRLDPGQYNGATLLGLRGCVVKSHGATDSHGLARAISVAYEQASLKLPELIEKRFGAVDESHPRLDTSR